MGAAFRVLVEFGAHAQTGHRSPVVDTFDAEPHRFDPLERLLFPLDRHAINRQANLATRIRPGRLVLLYVDLGNACVAVEPVGVRNKRPEPLGARFEIKLPSKMKLAITHFRSEISDLRSQTSLYSESTSS